MKTIKAFIAGLVFPATFLPFAYSTLFIMDMGEVRITPLEFFPLFVPIIFGLWNVIYWAIGERCTLKDRNKRLWFTGASLGVVVSLFGVFFLALPQLLFGFTGLMVYSPLLFVPIIYGLMWRYIVKHLNDLMGLQDW